MTKAQDAFIITDIENNAAGLFKFQIKQGNNTLNISSGVLQAMAYNSPDPGNRWMLVEAGDVEGSQEELIENAKNIALERKKTEVLEKIAPLSFLSKYQTTVEAINRVESEDEINVALENINSFVTIQDCDQSRQQYLQVGFEKASFISSSDDKSNVVKLISAGNGEFYLRGFNSGYYLGDVNQSAPIYTDKNPTTTFYIQKYTTDNIIIRPAKYADYSNTGGYHYVHNNGCVGWEASAMNSQHKIEEVAGLDAVEVNYEIIFNERSIETYSVYNERGSQAMPPKFLDRDYVTLSCDNETINEEHQNIQVTAQWDASFDIYDSFDKAEWKNLVVRGSYYLKAGNTRTVKDTTTDDEGNEVEHIVLENALDPINNPAKLDKITDAYMWAFVGDPWHIQLYNKAEGNSKVFIWTEKKNENVPTFIDASTTNNYWYVKTGTNTEYPNSFVLAIPNYASQLNQYQGGPLAIWAVNSTNSENSAFNIVELPDLSEEALAKIDSWLNSAGESNNKYFVLDDEGKNELNAWKEKYATACTYDEYSSLEQELLSVLVIPNTGYYRLRNEKRSNSYMGQTNPNFVGTFSQDDATGISTIIKLEKNDGNLYAIAVQGKYLQAAAKSATVATASTPAKHTVVVNTFGYAAFSANPDDKHSYIHFRGDGNKDLVGWTADAPESQWIVEDAKTVQITMHEAGDASWATVYAPFGLTLDESAEAYIGELGDGYINLTSIGQNIPAETAVIIKGSGTSVTATINDEITEKYDDNDLEGQYLAHSGDKENILTLGEDGGVVGFYKYTGDLGANKAFITISGSAGANGYSFVLDDDNITAIGGVEGAGQSSKAATYYDLQGRKVAAPQHGQLYIVNGKKVLY